MPAILRKLRSIAHLDFWFGLLIITLCIACFNYWAWFQPVNFRMMDWRSSIVERTASDDIVMVQIDTQSIDEFGIWPWPRDTFALAVEKLNRYQAKRIFLDIDFSSRSQIDQDQRLALALENSSAAIILPTFTQTDASGTLTLSQPLPMFAANSMLGSANIRPETDGLFRRIDLFHQDSLLTAPNVVSLLLESSVSSDSFFIDYSIDPQSIPKLSIADLIAERFNPNMFQGKVVIIGASAIELGDIKAVPNYFMLPGASLVALGYETVIQQRQLSFVPMLYQFLAIALLFIYLCLAFRFKHWQLGILSVVLAAIAIEVSAVFLQINQAIVLPSFALHLLCALALIQQVVTRLRIEKLLSLRHLIAQRNAEAWAHTIVVNSSEAIVRTQLDGTIVECNDRTIQMLGLNKQQCFGQNIETILGIKHAPNSTHEPLRTQYTNAKSQQLEIEYTRRLVELSGKSQLAYLIHDITQQLKYERQLHHQATHDLLTGIANRSQIQQQSPLIVQAAKLQGAQFAVVMLDLDNFKDVNDALGHKNGDLVLEAVAQKLQTVTQTELLARLGGDEFVLVFSPTTDINSYSPLLKKLEKIFSQRFKIHDIDLSISASLGIAYYPEHGEDFETLLKHADIAMYQAKQKMLFSCVYQDQYQQATLRRLMLFGDLRDAVSKEQIELFFQPKVSITNGSTVGAEVLARWHHPQLGSISPDEFIDIAEHTGLIQGLSFYIIEKAIEQAHLWQSQGIDINVAVNLSPKNLLDLKLVDYFVSQFEKAPLALNNFSIEVTETVIMQNSAHCIYTLEKLRDMGLKISIDDFGTGHSSLQYLDKLPVDELKIDRSFLLELRDSPAQQMIVSTVIQLAHNLDMLVVCEGVEDEISLNMLAEFGADIAQGYLFSPPQSKQAFNTWLVDQQQRSKLKSQT